MQVCLGLTAVELLGLYLTAVELLGLYSCEKHISSVSNCNTTMSCKPMYMHILSLSDYHTQFTMIISVWYDFSLVVCTTILHILIHIAQYFLLPSHQMHVITRYYGNSTNIIIILVSGRYCRLPCREYSYMCVLCGVNFFF